MKLLKKIFLIVMIIICALGFMLPNISNASSVSTLVGNMSAEAPKDEASTDLRTTMGKVLGFLQLAAGLVSVIVIATTGFNYIISTPDVKEEMKKRMFPIVMGLVLVFGAVSIAKFILAAVGG